MEKKPEATETISKLIQTVHRLRAPGGCPWDRSQTHHSLRPHLIEEAYEVLEVLDRLKKDEDLKIAENRADLREELGDLLMQVVLHAEMASEQGLFDFSEIAGELNDKLIRRHPHVFANQNAANAEAALQTWEQQKAKEKSAKAEAQSTTISTLDGLPKSLPSLQRATRTIQKVTKVGFQWPDLEGPLEKLREELKEFENEVKNKNASALSEELGDLLFCICNVAHFLKLNPEDALRSTLQKFENRFRHVEASLAAQGKSPSQSNLQEMDRYWEEAKSLEEKKPS